MKIILSRDVAIDGRHHSAGETVDVSDSDGIALVNMGKAQPKNKAKEKRTKCWAHDQRRTCACKTRSP